MRRGLSRGMALLFVCAFVCAFLATIGCALAAGQSDPKVVAGGDESISGKQLYTTYCALCHGADAKGGGPFSPQLKAWPPELTGLTKKNNGTFPAMHVKEAIDGEFAKPSHGTADMPIWGPVFRLMAHGRKDSAQVRLNNLVKYLESIQEK